MLPNGRTLLVEGRDDREVVYQFCNIHGVSNRDYFSVEAKDGYENLREDLSIRPKASDSIVGAIIDADEDLAVRWLSITGVLIDLGYDMPAVPPPNGLIIDHTRFARVGLWVMPNNTTAGILETFLALLVDNDDDLFPVAMRAVAEIPLGMQRFRDVDKAKAHIHTWLAWQEQPGTSLGLAITRRYLDANTPIAGTFLSWLRSLFQIPM